MMVKSRVVMVCEGFHGKICLGFVNMCLGVQEVLPRAKGA